MDGPCFRWDVEGLSEFLVLRELNLNFLIFRFARTKRRLRSIRNSSYPMISNVQ